MFFKTEQQAEKAKPPLVCANCGKDPLDHSVTGMGPSERLTCPAGLSFWKDTDDRRAWDIMRQLDELDRRRARLDEELTKLWLKGIDEARLLKDANSRYSSVQLEEMQR